jgi:hypothetical protein
MSGTSVNLPIALDFGNLLVLALGTAIAFVWRTLNEKIEAGDRLCDSTSRERATRLDDKLNTLDLRSSEKLSTLETAFVSLPQRMDSFAEQLKRIELMLANHYATKEELRTEVSAKIGRLDKFEGVLARSLEALAERERDRDRAELAPRSTNRKR